MTILDRYLFFCFIRAFVLIFGVFIGLYVMIDLFANFDELGKDANGSAEVARRILHYYSLHSLEYFARLAPLITQAAAMYALAELKKNNELTPMLAAGIPTRRALAPILFGVLCVAGLGVANREIFLPANAEFLQRGHDDVGGNRELDVGARMDSEGMLVRVEKVTRAGGVLENVKLTMPDLAELAAAKATFDVYGPNRQPGLLLTVVESTSVQPTDKVTLIGDRQVFIRTDLTFAEITRGHSWALFASTKDLLAELDKPQVSKAPEVRAVIHNRFMQPAACLLLVLLGVRFVLGVDSKSVYTSLAAAIMLSAAYFVVDAVSVYTAGQGFLDPQIAAWTPIFLFGPIAATFLHKVAT